MQKTKQLPRYIRLYYGETDRIFYCDSVSHEQLFRMMGLRSLIKIKFLIAYEPEPNFLATGEYVLGEHSEKFSPAMDKLREYQPASRLRSSILKVDLNDFEIIRQGRDGKEDARFLSGYVGEVKVQISSSEPEAMVFSFLKQLRMPGKVFSLLMAHKNEIVILNEDFTLHKIDSTSFGVFWEQDYLTKFQQAAEDLKDIE